MLRYFIFSCVFIFLHSLSYSQFELYNLANIGEPVNQVTSIGVMNSGKAYIGTYDAGLITYDGVSSWSSFNTSTSGFPNDYITSVYINSSDVWIGTQFGGIGKYSGGAWSSINSSNSQLPVDEVWGMHMDANGNLSIATYGGLAIDSIPENTWSRYDMSNTAALEAESFYAIFADPAGVIWLGTEGKGLVRLSSNTWEFYTTQNSGIANDTVNVIKRSSDGSLWIGTDLGLSKFDGITWTTYTAASTSAGLPGDKINSIAFDNSGNMYVGTDKGLGVHNKTSNEWMTFTSTSSNLPENNITAVAIDPNTETVWIGTASQGLAVAANYILLSNKDKVTILENVIVYPNPVGEVLNINFECIRQTDIHISVLDLYGREIVDLGSVRYTPGQYKVSKDFSHVEKGIYMLQMVSQEGRIIKRIQVY